MSCGINVIQRHTRTYTRTVNWDREPRPSKIVVTRDVALTLVNLKLQQCQALKAFKRKQRSMRKSCDRSRGMTNLRNEAESQGIDTTRRLYPYNTPFRFVYKGLFEQANNIMRIALSRRRYFRLECDAQHCLASKDSSLEAFSYYPTRGASQHWPVDQPYLPNPCANGSSRTKLTCYRLSQ